MCVQSDRIGKRRETEYSVGDGSDGGGGGGGGGNGVLSYRDRLTQCEKRAKCGSVFNV